MNSEDTIKKFDNIVRLRHCIGYHPIMNPKDYVAMKYLEGNRYKSKSALLPVHFYLNMDTRRN